MKALLLSLVSIFSLLFLMASCQNLGAQRALSSYDIRTEIVYSGGFELEQQVSSIVKKASATKSMAMKRSEFN